MTAIIKDYKVGQQMRRFTLAITRVNHATAKEEARKLRKAGLTVRMDKEPDGKYNLYSRWN